MLQSNSLLAGLLSLLTLGMYEPFWFGSKRDYLEANNERTHSFLLTGFILLLVAADIIASLYLQSKYLFQAQHFRLLTIYIGAALLALYVASYVRWGLKSSASMMLATNYKVASKLVALPFGLGALGIMVMQNKINADTALASKPAAAPATMTVPGAPVSTVVVSAVTDTPSAETPTQPVAANPAGAAAVVPAGSIGVPSANSGDDWMQGIATIQPSVVGAEPDAVLPAAVAPETGAAAPQTALQPEPTSWQEGVATIQPPVTTVASQAPPHNVVTPWQPPTAAAPPAAPATVVPVSPEPTEEVIIRPQQPPA